MEMEPKKQTFIDEVNKNSSDSHESILGKKSFKSYKTAMATGMIALGLMAGASTMLDKESSNDRFHGKTFEPTEQQLAEKGSVMTANNSVIESTHMDTTDIDPESTKGYWENFEKRHANDPEPIPDKAPVDTST